MTTQHRGTPLAELLPRPFAVRESEIRTYSSKSQHMGEAFELLKRVTQSALVTACILPAAQAWTRDEAIVVGTVMRLAKLLQGFLRHVMEREQELARLLLRSVFEAATNIKYFVQEGSPELFAAFVRYSLRQEKKLLAAIDANIAARGGLELPAEDRMKRSVARAFSESDIDPSSVDPSDKRSWGGTIHSRATAVGYGPLYLAAFGLGSNEVHGNWQDLLMYNLERTQSGFVVSPDWTAPVPQESLGASIVASDALMAFVGTRLPKSADRELLSTRLDSYLKAALALQALHEEFVVANGNGE